MSETKRIVLLLAAAATLILGACMRAPNPSMEAQDINEVLAAHQGELMSIPGVVGVFIGLAEDDPTECIKVMLKEPNPAAEERIPRVLEGFQVITEVTGEIRPLDR